MTSDSEFHNRLNSNEGTSIMSNRSFDTDLLHSPAREHAFDSLEAHVQAASALARAAYLLMDYIPGATGDFDPRDRYALAAVVTAAADHASAAEVLMSAAPNDLKVRLEDRLCEFRRTELPETASRDVAA
ncbi:hypothetical protein [Pinisolibacter aquiterrae]|uniref:hypothetical protein n=1 Tax=Pinisolibacter aquiterrae TaxID=2815579 RepID=UPI001C3DB4B8|nr:hypothetical protein [Pinisolibacter aquiterrae]MBV5266080.1 hypothetical protein [Pinisolibacter aquiterrae]MCC8233627.1 hypothetical protein [Pinisolibacter aquiterrae]